MATVDARALLFDPQTCLEPWLPTTSDPWNRQKAAHLLRRAGFGASPQSIDHAVAAGPAAAIEALFTPTEDPTTAAIDAMGPRLMRQRNIDRVAAWWLRLMLETNHPLRERLALLWHGHFAVSADKVTSTAAIYGQLELFRSAGFGDLRTLARGVVHDPAMLRFLDADRIRVGHPNENLARELFELFLLGIGNYTERDIQEAARALTGLRLSGDRSEWVERYHDTSAKTVFGRTAAFTPDTLVHHCFEQPAAARFFATTLAREFVGSQLPDETLETLAALLRKEEFRVDRFLRVLFASRLFFDASSIRARIASPVEFVIGTLRALDARANSNTLARQVGAMGQRLFHPPGVQGWSGGTDWISSGRIIARNQFGRSLASADEELGAQFDWEALCGDRSRSALLDHLIVRFISADLPAAVRDALVAHDGDPRDWIHLLITLPEAQLV